LGKLIIFYVLEASSHGCKLLQWSEYSYLNWISFGILNLWECYQKRSRRDHAPPRNKVAKTFRCCFIWIWTLWKL